MILCHIISSGMIMAIMIGRRKIAVFHWNIYIYMYDGFIFHGQVGVPERHFQDSWTYPATGLT